MNLQKLMTHSLGNQSLSLPGQPGNHPKKSNLLTNKRIPIQCFKILNVGNLVHTRLSLKKLFALEFHQRCRLAPWSQNILYISLYYAHGKWYFQSKIGQFGPIQASRTKLENGVSLSTGIVEQNVKYVLWSGSQCASLVKFESKKFF